MNREERSRFIKNTATRLGFSHCGIAKAEFLREEAPLLEKWLKQGRHGSMDYMERNFDKRLDPTKLVKGAKSVVSLLLNYFPKESDRRDPSLPKISVYAFGKDYHLVIKEKLFALKDEIERSLARRGASVASRKIGAGATMRKNTRPRARHRAVFRLPDQAVRRRVHRPGNRRAAPAASARRTGGKTAETLAPRGPDIDRGKKRGSVARGLARDRPVVLPRHRSLGSGRMGIGGQWRAAL